MARFDIEHIAGCVPTSYGSGPFHPAFQTATGRFYWPNITFETEDEAYKRAEESLLQAFQSAKEHMNQWNVWPV